MMHLVSRSTGFFIVAVIILHWRGALTTRLINSPDPMNVVAPLNSTVVFTCVVNTTELPLQAIVWKVDGAFLSGDIDQLEMTNGSLEIGVLQLTVLHNYLTGVLVQCAVVQESTVFMSSI